MGSGAGNISFIRRYVIDCCVMIHANNEGDSALWWTKIVRRVGNGMLEFP